MRAPDLSALSLRPRKGAATDEFYSLSYLEAAELNRERHGADDLPSMALPGDKGATFRIPKRIPTADGRFEYRVYDALALWKWAKVWPWDPEDKYNMLSKKDWEALRDQYDPDYPDLKNVRWREPLNWYDWSSDLNTNPIMPTWGAAEWEPPWKKPERHWIYYYTENVALDEFELRVDRHEPSPHVPASWPAMQAAMRTKVKHVGRFVTPNHTEFQIPVAEAGRRVPVADPKAMTREELKSLHLIWVGSQSADKASDEETIHAGLTPLLWYHYLRIVLPDKSKDRFLVWAMRHESETSPLLAHPLATPAGHGEPPYHLLQKHYTILRDPEALPRLFPNHERILGGEDFRKPWWLEEW